MLVLIDFLAILEESSCAENEIMTYGGAEVK